MKLPLEDGKTYYDSWGSERKVIGPSGGNPDWVWTLSGFWYERATGKHVFYGKRNGEWVHFVHDEPHPQDLIRSEEDE